MEGNIVIVELEGYGGGVSVADNTAALRNALTALATAGGGTLRFRSGTYQFASATLTGAGAEVPSAVSIEGAGKGVTHLVITGTTACYLFLNEGCHSDQHFRDFTVRGNSVASDAGPGPGAFYYCSVLAGTSIADVADVNFSNIRLENFKGDSWIKFLCTSTTHSIHRCGLAWGFEAQSEFGNARDPNSIGVNSNVFELRADGGHIYDCFADGPWMDLRGVKVGIAVFSQVHRTIIRSPVLLNAFQDYAVSDKGAYAILLYDHSGVVTDTVIESPTIGDPYSCGIYLAGTRNTQISNPHIWGQVDTGDATLPKGAIAMNGPETVLITNPLLHDNYWNISAVGPAIGDYSANANVEVIGGRGYNAGDSGVKLRCSIHYALAGGYRFIGYKDTGATVNAVSMFGLTGHAINDVLFESCEFGANGSAVNWNRTGLPAAGHADIVFRNCRISAVGATSYSMVLGGATAGLAVIDGVHFDAPAAFHIVMDAATNVEITRNRFRGAATYNCELEGTRGLFHDNVAFNGADLVESTPNALGRSAPTWSAGNGVFVQNALAGAGSYGSWRCVGGSTWKGTDAIAA